MTISEWRAKRVEIEGNIGVVRVRMSDGRETEFANSEEALKVIDAEIARAESQASGGSRFRTSFATFTK